MATRFLLCVLLLLGASAFAAEYDSSEVTLTAAQKTLARAELTDCHVSGPLIPALLVRAQEFSTVSGISVVKSARLLCIMRAVAHLEEYEFYDKAAWQARFKSTQPVQGKLP